MVQNGIPYSTIAFFINHQGNISSEVSNNLCSIISNKINYNVNINELDKNKIYIYTNPFISQAILDLSKFQDQKLKF